MQKIFSRVSVFTILVFLLLKNSPVIRAETIIFEDDFSNGFEKWESVRNNFEMWQIIDEQADVFIDRSSTLAELVPKDLYWNPEWKNIIYELDYKYLRGADKNISFGFKDVLNWYEIHFVGGSFFLSHIKNGKLAWDLTGRTDLLSDAFNHIKIVLNEGLINVFINQEEIINVVDPTFDNDYGKIGLKAGAGSIFPTHAIYDNIVVRSLDNLVSKLPIVAQKQTDPAWAKEEYDSAQKWAEEIGIEHWGCLITSISMIMNYHGIGIMPNGDPVNPSTLNSWLISQPDGYIGSGLVNWLAISRLTKLISDQFSTPKFEYQRITGNDFTVAKDQIDLSNPVILETNGHFVVGDGVIYDENDKSKVSDLYITDPAYNYEKFSQHNKSLVSTRTLEPSYTDLSYLHISHDPSINVKISNNNGQLIENLQTFEDYIGDFNADESSNGGGFSENISPTIKINELEKPDNGEYFIEVSQETFGPVNLTIFTYNINGELTDLSYSGLVGKNKIIFKLNYSNDASSYIEKIINFNTLKNDISELSQLNEIRKHYVTVELEQFTEFANESSSENFMRYINALQQLVNWYSSQISETGQSYLNQRLLEIKLLQI